MQNKSVLTRGSLMISSALLTWLALPGNFSFWPLLIVCLVPFFRHIVGSIYSSTEKLRGQAWSADCTEEVMLQHA